jgi:2-dehydropantoate 2-reductase
MEDPRIAVVGAGANGAAIGADLTRAGHDVTLVEQWPSHVAAMQRDGITVHMPTGTETTAVTAIDLCDVATLREPFDIVIVVVKAYDTRWATELIKPLLAPDGRIVGLQNGMTVDPMLDIIGPERTVGAVLSIAGNMFEPGIVNRQTPPDRSWFGLGYVDREADETLRRLADVLAPAAAVEVVDDIRSAKWMKLVANAAELVPSALTDLPLAEAAEIPGMLDFMYECGREAIEATLVDGSRIVPIFGKTSLDPDDDPAARLLDIVINEIGLPDTRTTVLQDWMKGRRAEGDDVNGHVVATLGRVGREAPANALVVGLAHRVERGEVERGGHLAEVMVASGIGQATAVSAD